MAEAADEELNEEEENALIARQPRNRVIRGIVKVNFQSLQLRSLMLQALHCTKGPEINAPYRIQSAVRYFTQANPELQVPSRQSFMRVRDKFIAYDVAMVPRRDKPSHVKDRIRARLNQIFDNNPSQSCRGVAVQLGANRETTRQVAKETRFPYKDKILHALEPIDLGRRLRYCQNILRRMQRLPNFLLRVCNTDESIFTSRGVVNKQVYRHWYRKGENGPSVYLRDNQHRWSVMVWAGILRDRIIGPFFFDGNLNAEVYSAFLIENLPTMFENNPVQPRQIWWQQDGAPPHNSIGTTNVLNHRFGPRWFGLRGPQSWPTRSPDLTPCDTFLWAFLKNKCYREPATTRENMMERIRHNCRLITPQMLANVRANLARRIECVVQQNGNLIEHLPGIRLHVNNMR